MSYKERSIQIIDYLKQRKTATVTELARVLYVSEATIRRDLTEMQKLGQIERSHGGALLPEGSDELSIFISQTKYAKEKIKAVSVALKHLPEFQTVFIDNSATCLALAERINFSRKTVVTNGLQIATYVSRHDGVTVILPGGEVKGSAPAVTGGMALETLRDFHFDLALLSCSAVDAEGSYELSLEQTLVKRVAIQQSNKRVLIFDRTKVNERAPYRAASLDCYDAIVTDADDDALVQLRKAHPKVFNN